MRSIYSVKYRKQYERWKRAINMNKRWEIYLKVEDKVIEALDVGAEIARRPF